MMYKQRRILQVVLLVVILLATNPQTVISATQNENTEECTFCQEHELTIKEKCEELYIKALIDEDIMLQEGVITEEVYKLQCEPFEEALDKLENSTEEETLESYKSILEYFFCELSEYEAEGEEIDKQFYDYILEEIEKVGLKDELGL